ncbi:MAG: MFS transporter [Bacteroidota bacterium]
MANKQGNSTEENNESETPTSVSTGYAVGAIVLGFLGNLFSGLVSTLMATYLPDSVYDLLGSLSEADVSFVGSYIGAMYIAGWAVGGILFGWLADRIGRIRTLSGSLLVVGIATTAASFSPNWIVLVALRLVTGMGVGATMVLCAVFGAEIWGKRVKGRAIAMSILAVGFPIGIISSGLVTWLITDWRMAFLSGLAPLLLGLLTPILFSEPPQWKRSSRSEDSTESGESEWSWLLNPENKTNFIAGAVIFGAMSVGIWSTFSWLPTWAQDLARGTDGALQVGGTLIALLGMGGIVGSLLSGPLANGLGRRRTLMIAFAGAGISAILLFLTNNHFSPIIYSQTAGLALFFGFSQGILMAYIPELFPTAIRSTATGICFNLGRMVTALAVFFVGYLVPILGGYGNALLVFSITYVIGFSAVVIAPETRDKVL